MTSSMMSFDPPTDPALDECTAEIVAELLETCEATRAMCERDAEDPNLHDMNDMLSAIISYASIVRDELAEGSAHREDLAVIILVAKRASKMAKRLERSLCSASAPDVTDPSRSE